MAKIKVYLGDEQPSGAGHDAGFTGGPMQLLESPAIHHAATDEHSPSKKRKVTFVESTPQPAGDNVEEPHSSQSLPNSEPPPEVPATLDVISAEGGNVEEPVSTLPNSEPSPEVTATRDVISAGGDNVEEPNSTLPSSKPPPEIPVIFDVISADAEGAHETSDKRKKRKTGKTEKKRKSRNEDPISEDQSLGEKVQSDIAVVTRKDPEESQRHTPSIDPSGVDVSTQPPKETKKVRMEVVIVGKESNAALSPPISATSNSSVVLQRAKGMFYKISTSFWSFTMHF